MSFAPARDRGTRHCHRGERFGTTHQIFRLIVRGPCCTQHRIAALGFQQLGGHGQPEDQQRNAYQRTQAEQRMNPGDREHIEQQPWPVEQRERARATEEGAQQLDVPQGIERIRNCSGHQVAIERSASGCERVTAQTVRRVHEQHSEQHDAAEDRHTVEELQDRNSGECEHQIEREARAECDQRERPQPL